MVAAASILQKASLYSIFVLYSSVLWRTLISSRLLKVNFIKMPTVFKPPVDVSPLIRFGRWSFLFAGIAYGAFWQSRYTNYELSVKDQKLKEKAERDARIALEKKIKADQEMAELEAMGRGGSK